MKSYREFQSGAIYGVLRDFSQSHLRMTQPKFEVGERVQFMELRPAPKEAFMLVMFKTLDRPKNELIWVDVADSEPQPDWDAHFRKI